MLSIDRRETHADTKRVVATGRRIPCLCVLDPDPEDRWACECGGKRTVLHFVEYERERA